jgi:hypothetical protein
MVRMAASASAQDKTVDRTAQGQAGKDVQVGVYVNVQDDCTSGPLPTIRLSTPATHGTVTVKESQGQRHQLQAMSGARSDGLCCALQVTT